MKRPSRRRILLFLLAAVLLTVVLGVWITYQFPSLAAGRKSSVEVLEDLFKAPVVVTEENAQQALKDVSKDAAVVFIRACDLPADVEAALAGGTACPAIGLGHRAVHLPLVRDVRRAVESRPGRTGRPYL